MEASIYQELVGLKMHGVLPDNLNKTQRHTILRQAKKFGLKDNELHYIRRDGNWAKVVNEREEVENLLLEFHNRKTVGHCGVEKTLHSLSMRFYWPGMSVDVKTWIKQCAECQGKKTSIKIKSQYTPIVVSEPLEIVGMDLIGKVSKTEEKYEYICVMVDYFTKWSEALPLKSKTAEEVTRCISKLFYNLEH